MMKYEHTCNFCHTSYSGDPFQIYEWLPVFWTSQRIHQKKLRLFGKLQRCTFMRNLMTSLEGMTSLFSRYE